MSQKAYVPTIPDPFVYIHPEQPRPEKVSPELDIFTQQDNEKNFQLDMKLGNILKECASETFAPRVGEFRDEEVALINSVIQFTKVK